MAWTSPRTWVTGEVVTAAMLNSNVRDNTAFLKNGVTYYVKQTSDSAAISTVETTLSSLPSLAFDGTTYVKISFSWYYMLSSVAGDNFFLTIKANGTGIATFLLYSASVSSLVMINGSSVFVTDLPDAGNTTYTATLLRNSGTGTATLKCNANTPATLLVEQTN